MSRRAWLPIGLALVLVAGAVVAVVLVRRDGPGCSGGDRPVAAGSVSSIFDTSPPFGDPDDHRLRRLVAAARGWQLGRVVGAVGYDYGQWLTVAGLPGHLGAWTKRNPVFGALDPQTLAPAWGIHQAAHPHAYDLSDTTFYEIQEPPHSPAEVSAYAMGDGHRLWCTPLGDRPLRQGDSLSTVALADGDLLVLSGRSGHLRLSRVGGSVSWSRPIDGADRGDYLAGPWHGVVLAGGRPLYRLGRHASPVDASGRSRPVLVAADPGTGAKRWQYDVPAGAEVHVLGTTAKAAVVLEQSQRSQRLVALDPRGHRLWSTRPDAAIRDAALRGNTVVVRDARGLVGYDARTGQRRWTHAVPATPQPFPYGFVLDQQPMLDAEHLLLGGTRALVSLDLATGTARDYPLPTDGINTTYWPYQVVVTARLVVVVTNTGAVVLRRDGGIDATDAGFGIE